MRAALLLIIVSGLLPFCIARPHIGAYVWAWISFMSPHKLTWGAQYLPIAGLLGLAFLFGFLLSLFTKSRPFLPVIQGGLGLVLLWLVFTITTPFAIFPGSAWTEWVRVSKVLLMTFVTVLVIDDQEKLRNLVRVTALSIGFFGLKGGLFSILSGGNYLIFGPEGSFIFDNNALAVALGMNLPLLLYLSREEPSLAARAILKAIFLLSVIAIIFTYSRGGFLTLSVVGLMLFWKTKGGPRKILAILALTLLVLPAGLAFIPDQWFARISSIQNYEQDLSALGRLNAWKLSWRLAVDRPLTGGGFQVTDNSTIYDLYYPDSPTRTGVHSIYFQVLGSNGFIGFAIFVAIIVWTILSMRRLDRKYKDSTDFKWLSNYSQMVQISLIGYAIGGAFLELATFDLFYHLVGIGIIIKHEAKKAAGLSSLPSEQEYSGSLENLRLSPNLALKK